MIQINNIKKQFGPRVIFDDASTHILPKRRVGLVGPNGSGKTTLFRLLTGEELLDSGNIVIGKEIRLGYLKQDVLSHPERSIIAEVLAGFPELQLLEQKIIDIEQQLEEQQTTEILDRYGKFRQKFEAAGGYSLEHEAKKILAGLGFHSEQFTLPVQTLSGGWLMRVALARLLLSKPDVLLLDEPTNHLDLNSIIWLEDFLLNYPGAIILTSHDQLFMQKIAQSILEVSQEKLTMFVGDLEAFAEEKAAQQERLASQYKNQQKKIQQVEQFIERFRYKATKAKQVQSRIKALDKIDRVELDEDTAKRIKFRLPSPPRCGQEIIKLTNVKKNYDTKVVYGNLNFTLMQGEKIALVGENGAGKTTLLKMIAGMLEVSSGVIDYGHRVIVEYYAQHQLETLNPKASIFDEISTTTAHLSPEQRRKLLGAFLFSGDDVFKQIDVLSGGEKARVALAKMLGQSANLLVMDEPTNHLDILSRQILEDALAGYEGSLVFISHDRAFINAIATKIIEVQNGELRSYPGNYDDYNQQKANNAIDTESIEPIPLQERSKSTTRQSRKEERRLRAAKVQKRSQRLRPIKKRLSDVEGQITELEKEKEILTEEICDVEIISDTIVYPQKLQRQRELDALLAKSIEEWTNLSEQIETIQTEDNI